MSIPQTPSPLSNILAAKTYNAAWFSGSTKELQITNAIAAALADGASYVYIPLNMTPYDASSVTFSNSVKLLCEGTSADVYNVRAYGAAADNVTDDTIAINKACDAANANRGLLYFEPEKTFKITGTVYVKSACRGSGSTLSYTGSGIALQVSDGVNLVQTVRIELPSVIQSKVGLGWGGSIATTIGVRVSQMFNCDLVVPMVQNFAIGLNFYGQNSQGSDYNKIYINRLHNNQVNLKIDADATSWCNENSFYGGRLSFDPAELQSPNTTATGQPGTRQIQITKPTSFLLNNHRFYSLSLESDVPEYHVDISSLNTLFDFCRWEAAFPKVRISGATALENAFRGGYNMSSVVFTYANGASTLTQRIDRAGKVEPTSIVHGFAKGAATLDATTYPVTIANNATAQINTVGQALVFLEDRNTGRSALIVAGFAPIWESTAGSFSGTAATVNRYNVYISGGNLFIENKSGLGTADMTALVFRIA